jgi:hypothetical protein
MNHPPDERAVLVLREKVRTAAIRTQALRNRWRRLFHLFTALAGVLLVVVIVIVRLSEHGVSPLLGSIMIGLALLLVVLLLATLLVAGLIYPVAAFQRRRLRRRLHRDFRGQPAEQLHRALLPLRAAPLEDSRKIVEPLLRELSLPGELSPADAPTGRGDEPTPPEDRPGPSRTRGR